MEFKMGKQQNPHPIPDTGDLSIRGREVILSLSHNKPTQNRVIFQNGSPNLRSDQKGNFNLNIPNAMGKKNAKFSPHNLFLSFFQISVKPSEEQQEKLDWVGDKAWVLEHLQQIN